MMSATYLRIHNFIALSLLAHLIVAGLLSVVQLSTRPPADRPLQVRVVDQSVLTRSSPPHDERMLGDTARAQRPAEKTGPPRTPNSSEIPQLPAAARPEASSTHLAELTPWEPPPLRTSMGLAVTPGPKAAQVEPLKGESIGRSSHPSDLRGQLAGLWKSLDARQFPDQEADTGEEGDTGSPAEQTVSLGSKDSRFASYLLEVKRRIEGFWSYPQKARGLSGNLVVTFAITRDGHLSDLQLTRTSGVAPLDDEAIRAIRQATPFAPFPKRMRFKRLNIRAAFYYHVSRTSFRDR